MSETTIQLPDGCYGVQMPWGEERNASKAGGRISVPDEYVPVIEGSSAARDGLVSTSRGYSVGTRRGRPCNDDNGKNCLFVAQVWSDHCPSCGSTTGEAR